MDNQTPITIGRPRLAVGVTRDLRQTLANTLDALQTGKITEARAHAVAKITNAICNTFRVEIMLLQAAKGAPDALGALDAPDQ